MTRIVYRRPQARVVCLHASGASSREWQPLADRLGDSWRVLAPDLYGHATAPAWTGAPQSILHADAARVVQVALSDGPAHLVGHSYGGAVALSIALQHPDRVHSVTLYEPVLFRLLRDFAPSAREARHAAGMGLAVRRDLAAGLPRLAARRFVDYWSGRGTFAALPENQQQSIARRMSAIAAHFVALWNDDATLSRCAGLAVPVTLLAGSRTHTATRRITELLRSVLPHSAYATMPGLGHMGPVTHAQVVAQRVATDLAAHEHARPAAPRELAA